MKKKFLTIVPVLLSALLFLACKGSDTADVHYPPGQNPVFVSRFETLTDEVIASGGVPGILVGVWAPDHDVAWVTAKGKADTASGTEMNAGLRFRMGSVTKSFTYTVLLQLVDEGKLSLDDKLSRFFPAFPDADKVTIRMICNHTSGIFNYIKSNTFGETINVDPGKVWTDQEFIEIASSQPFYFQPGTGYTYSNTNTIMAGMIVEKITGNSIDAEISQRLLIPLGLKDTYYPRDIAISGEHAHGYQGGDVTERFHPSSAGSSGALVTTIQDLKRWVEAAVRGNLLSADLQKERLAVVPPAENYGLGLKAMESGGSEPVWGHAGAFFGYQTMAFHWREKNVTIVISYNTTLADPAPLFHSLIDTFK